MKIEGPNATPPLLLPHTDEMKKEIVLLVFAEAAISYTRVGARKDSAEAGGGGGGREFISYSWNTLLSVGREKNERVEKDILKLFDSIKGKKRVLLEQEAPLLSHDKLHRDCE